MKFIIEFDVDNAIVRARASGVLRQDKRREMLQAIADVLTSSNSKKVIIDLMETSIDPREPVSNAFELIPFMQAIGIQTDVKISFLHRQKVYHREFFEELALKSSYQIKYFIDPQDALIWLG